MDFQENKQTETQDTAPVQQQPSSADNARSTDNSNQPSEQNGQAYGNNNGSPYPNGQPYQNRPPYGNGTPYPAPQQPYRNNNGPAQPPYGNNYGASPQNGGSPYRNNTPYGSQYPNGNPYPGGYRPGNSVQDNRYNNNYPYYGRNTYQLPVSEPGGSLAKAAMICGVLAACFGIVFPIYPTFALGCTAIILALLSKGRRPKLLSKARVGMICGIVGLVLNIIVIAASVVPIITDPAARERFEEQWESIYGVPFEDVMEDIMENEGYNDYD